MKNKKKIIIFDLDGTILKFSDESFDKSVLNKKITFNTVLFVKNYLGISDDIAIKILNNIKQQYGEEVSIGLEKEYGINKLCFFNQVWNIKDKNFIKKDRSIQEVLLKLQKKYSFFILSDAPRVWIDIVLNKLTIEYFFRDKIYSGDGDYRKSLGNAFENLINQTGLNPKQCISVGDQESTDIIPARLLGMKTIFINSANKKASLGVSVNQFNEITKYL